MKSLDFTIPGWISVHQCSNLRIWVRLLRDFLNSVIFVGFISPVNMLLFITFDMPEKKSIFEILHFFLKNLSFCI